MVRCTGLIFIFMFLGVSVQAIDVEVKQDGSGVGGYTTIAAGIAAACADGVGGTVTVLDSATYREANGGILWK